MPDWGVENREVWATEQLKKAQVFGPVSSAVQRLLRTWAEIHLTSLEEAREALALFAHLAQDHALDVPEENWDWTPVRPGQIRVADVIRVKLDAYRGQLGEQHNGRVGRVVAIRSGDIIVNMTDGEPKIEGAHHSPYALDKRVPR